MIERLLKIRWLGISLVCAGLGLFFLGIWIGLVWHTWISYPIAAAGIVIGPIGGLIQLLKSE